MSTRRRSFYTLFLTIVLVIAIPISIIIVSFSTTIQKMVREDCISYNLKVIENIHSIVDSSITSRKQLVYTLSSNLSLKILTANIDKTLNETNSACKDLYNFCRSIQTYDSLYAMTAIYIPNRDLVISSVGTRLSGNEFYNQYIEFVGMDADAFFDTVQSAHTNEYYSSTRTEPIIGSSKELILNVQPIDLGYLSYHAYFVSMIDTSTFSRLLTHQFNEGVYYRVLNVQGDTLTCSTDMPWEWDNSQRHISNHWMESNLATPYHAFYSNSEASALQYIFYVPETTVLKRLKTFQYIWLAILAACMVIGLFIARIIAKKLYLPLHRLITQTFPSENLSNTKNIQEEYELLTDKIRETQIRNQQFQQEIRTYYESTRTHVVLRLLTQSSSMSDNELLEAMVMCELPLTEMFYQAIIMNGVEAEKITAKMYSSFTDTESSITLIKANLASDQIVFVVAIPQSKPEFIELLPNLIVSHIGSNTKIKIGISRLCKDPRGLQRCLNEASTACINHDLASIPFQFYDELVTQMETIYFPLEKEIRIISAVREGSFLEVKQQLIEIQEYNFVERKLAPEMELCLYNSLVGTALKAYNYIQSENPDLLQHSLDMLSRFNINSKMNEQIFDDILNLYQQICLFSQNSKANKNHKIINQVVEYLKENYSNTSLCMNLVADHFEVSYYFLSHIFKSETNKSFSDMLNNIRIERALELLRTSDISIQQISELTGYTNWSTFLRAFRKSTGTTPLQYRKDSNE